TNTYILKTNSDITEILKDNNFEYSEILKDNNSKYSEITKYEYKLLNVNSSLTQSLIKKIISKNIEIFHFEKFRISLQEIFVNNFGGEDFEEK
ncbi:MAG: hypothetical protein LBM93_08465, partial [Oscillospiraceae bacterium]|nr:hypothetical protein [Oscillospiraceae bacterium]